MDPKDRFQFGKNWKMFLNNLNDDRIEVAIQSLKDLFEVEDFKGKTFLDIGSGSGLFSLAGNKLGAKVSSFDYDVNSVECTRYFRDTYASGENWSVVQGSVLSEEYVKSHRQFDMVYSWGVLHHTGNMHVALDNASKAVKPGGKLMIAIYNDQGARSKVWTLIKRFYIKGFIFKFFILLAYMPYYYVKNFLIDVFYLRKSPMWRYRDFTKKRGMSVMVEVYDWLGGYPFEVASIPKIFDFYKERGFTMNVVTAKRGKGCNQFVFTKQALPK